MPLSIEHDTPPQSGSSQPPSHPSQPITTLELPPGHPGRAYTLPSLSGEIIYIPCSKSATRLLVTGKETSNAFAVVGSGGTQSPPIGFHYHNDAHDVFLCIKGSVNVWANDQCRTMHPGDFASVPPKTIHQYQILGTHTEFLGLIVPGGWEEFFRFIGEPYNAGPLFPLSDPRNPFEVLIPKLKAAAEKFDMIPCPRHPSFDPQPWLETDNQLPGTLSPYFLRNDTGPAYLAGNTITRPLATPLESNNRFSVASIESSNHSSYTSSSSSTSTSTSTSPLFPTPTSMLNFTSTHHAFQVSDGAVKFAISNTDSTATSSSTSTSTSTLVQGETIYIPSNTAFRFEPASKFTKMYAFSNGGGVSEVLVKLGQKYTGVLLPERAEATGNGEEGLKGLAGEFGFQIV